MIKNRNIAADAKIDVSKLDFITGKRVFFEDFNDDGGGALVGIDDNFAFNITKTNTPTALVQSDGTVYLDADADGDILCVFQASTWSTAKNPVMRCRIKIADTLDNNILQFGWCEGDGTTLPVGNPPADKDKAFIEYRGTGGSNPDVWVMRTNNNTDGGAETTTVSAQGAALDTWYNIEVALGEGGGAIGKITGGLEQTFISAPEAGTAVPTLTDWKPFIRVNANGAAASVYLDSFMVYEDRE